MQNSYLGVDGCRGGWIVVELNPSVSWAAKLVSSTDALAPLIQRSRLTLIDIPIGLLDSGGPQRECDQLARKALGMPRAASVFSVPSRAAVYANTYARACQINHRVLGKKLSKQTWNISGKIRQVDELLQNNPAIRKNLRECHPEVCFWALNNKTAMRFNKKQAAGREERMQLLTQYLPIAHHILDFAVDKYSRKQMAIDDIVDAMALAIAAARGFEALSSLPESPMLDSRGLKMEIAFWNPL
jgi:predicted RNase H-like nuclease